MVSQSLLDVFEHLVDMLHEAGSPAIIITMVEDAKEALEDHSYDQPQYDE
jgi:hypothetical protein